MNNGEKIQYLIELEKQKHDLEKKLELVNKNIEEQRKSCSHIGVNLGYYAQYPSTMNKYRCLLCGEGRDDDFFYVNDLDVNAGKYLTQYDVRDKSQCDIKFSHIQTLAIGLLKEDPNMSREELVDRLNNLIQESILANQTKNGPKLVKTKIPQK